MRILQAALVFADRNAVVEGYWDDRSGGPMPGCEWLRVYGGDGCPGVAEFAPIELGAVLGGKAVAWRAHKIADACMSLSLEAAAIVDRRVAGIVNSVTSGKLAAITKAAVREADPCPDAG